ncbi:MAG: ROK family protein [Clostridia bacterium]|nr:ROK family protein [Clostridia bacterium]
MYRIGIDLGGTNIVAGVVDKEYKLVATANCKTNMPRPADEIIADMARVSREAVKNAGLTMDDIDGVGVGCPGSCNLDKGVIERAENLGFVNEPLQEKLEKLLGKTVRIENDANAAAYGEVLAGAAKGTRHAVCITLGTGVGGGAIVDGTIVSGHNFAGGELGHTVIVADGEPCSCGRRGCWEAYSSATALIRQTKAAMQTNKDSKMWALSDGGTRVNGRTAFDAMREGDETAKQVVDTYIRYLACGLTNMVNIFQPQVLCVGGGISHEGETLLAPVREIVAREQYAQNTESKTVLCAAELGNDAGIIGAAYLDAAL